MTPFGAATGGNTPINPRSRSVSTENLASTNAMASGSIAANLLQNRLSNLDIAGGRSPPVDRDRSQLSTWGDSIGVHDTLNAQNLGQDRLQQSSPPSQNEGYFAQREGSSAGHTPNDRLSRRVSEEDDAPCGLQLLEHVEYSAENLAKVPSYSTALRSNPRTPINAGLPSYQTATRSPMPSPPIPIYVNDSRSSC